MNPGEQNQNPFRRTNTGHYFNARSRYNPSRHQSYQQANQNLYPQQYNQVQKPRRSKKPLFIGIGIVAVILIIVLVSFSIVPAIINGESLFGNIAKNSSLEDLQKLVTDNKESALVLYDAILDVTMEGVRLWSPDVDQTHVDIKGLRDKTEKASKELKAFRQELNKFGNVQGATHTGERINIDDKIIELKQKLDTQIKFFEKYSSFLIPTLNVYIEHGSKESLSAMESAAATEKEKEIVNQFKKYYEEYEKCKAANKSSVELSIAANDIIRSNLFYEDMHSILEETGNKEIDHTRNIVVIINEIQNLDVIK